MVSVFKSAKNRIYQFSKCALYFLTFPGQFGHVYIGQLQLNGNVLKTVAVKTLKGTLDQIQNS